VNTRPVRLVLAAAAILTPLVWHMRNENTAYAKILVLGLCAALVLATAPWPGLWSGVRHAVPLHVLLVFGLASAAFTASPSFGWPAGLLALTLWILVAAAAVPASPGFWHRTIIAAAIGPVLVGLLQVIHADPTPWGGLAVANFHGRICSTLGNPNFLAAFLAGTIPFLWPVAWLAGPALLVLLFTAAKGGLLGIVAAGTVGAVATRRPGPGGLPRPAKLAAAVAVITALGALAVSAPIRDRLLFSWTGESLRFRLLTWKQAVHMLPPAPVLGHGLGRFQVVYPRYRLPEVIRMFGQHSYMTDHPENLTLELATELGIAGLGLWLWLVVFVARSLARKLHGTDAGERRLAAACAAGLTGLFVANSFGVDVHYGATAALGALLLGIAIARPAGSSAAASPVSVPRPWAVAAAILLAGIWTNIYASDAALSRAIAYSSQGQWNPAIGWYRAAARLNATNVMARYFGASALLDRGDPADLPKAESLFDGVRYDHPDYVLLNYKYWLLYNRQGRRADADAALARQIALDPVAATFYLERGRLAVDEKRWADAQRDFLAAQSAEPDNPAGYQYLGNMLVLQGRYREALTAYATGLARLPGSEELHYNAAVAAYKAGDRKQARAHAEAVLAANPGHPGARLIISKLK
jgi:tetratricopeptide (TPR) repeat protein